MSRHGSQQRTLLGILGSLRPHWHSEAALAGRIDALISGDRRFGSRDRRLYRELVYTALRYLPWVEPLLDTDPGLAAKRIAWLAADIPAVRPFRDALSGDLPPCPADAGGKAALLGTRADDLTPAWLARECPEALEAPLRDALLSRAPLWLRLQTADPGLVEAEFASLGWAVSPSPRLPGALRLAAGTDVSRTRSYLEGRVEVQDIGSQLILERVAPSPGGLWLDLCAGAGGKSLQLASLLGPSGRVSARDIRRAALDELALRASRAGLGERISIGGPDPTGGFDGVLVDAPCSGSGTLRRSPHLRWTTSAPDIARACELQGRLLAEGASLVRKGGTLVYATCSLCRSENEEVAGGFLRRSPQFEPVIAGLRIAPPDPDGDAFFLASFRRL